MYNLMRKKKTYIIVLSGLAFMCPYYLFGKINRLSILVTSVTDEHHYSNTEAQSSKPSLPRVAQFWNENDFRKLSPNDKIELMTWRKAGRQDGIPLRHIINATSFISVPRIRCEQRRKLVVLVSSSCDHREHRNIIRRTWGNHSRLANVPVLFFTGICDQAITESAESDDIVVGNYVDSYYNLTFKTFSRLRWYMEYCSNSDYVLFCDDDVVVDSTVLLKYLPHKGNFSIVCSRNNFMPLIRDKKSSLAKWYVPKWLYEEEFYPPYCSGFAYLFNSTILPILYETSLELPYIYVDDAFITGFAPKELNIEVSHDQRFKVTNNEKLTCGAESVIASHWFQKPYLLKEWRNREETCGYKTQNKSI